MFTLFRGKSELRLTLFQGEFMRNFTLFQDFPGKILFFGCLFQCLMEFAQHFRLLFFGEVCLFEEFAQFFHGTRTHGGTPSTHTALIVAVGKKISIVIAVGHC